MKLKLSEQTISQIITEFYEKHKSILISIEEIKRRSLGPKINKKLGFFESYNISDLENVNPFFILDFIKETSDILFGFPNGTIFTKKNFYFISYIVKPKDILLEIVGPIPIERFIEITVYKKDKNLKSYYNLYLSDYSSFLQREFNEIEFESIEFLKNSLLFYIDKFDQELIEKNRLIEERKKISELENIAIQEENEKQRKIKLEETKLSIISELDKDSNNEVDLVDGDILNKLLINNQKSIIDIDKNYIQKFVKVSIYLKTKRSNIQKMFESIKDIKNDFELNELVNLLKNQIHTYDLLVFHSISMITSLVENELITFFEIHECFDQLGVFNSNWENEVSGKLTDIGNGIKDLMYTIYKMENKIVASINNLTYVNQITFSVLNNSIYNQLSKINSSLDYSNYMSKIQNYKMFDITI
jgi:hypothetical protein